MKKISGFTLLETLIYLALFGILMGGVVAAVYGIVQAGGRGQTKIILQEEGDFLLGKFSWALSGASSFSIAGSPPQLTVNQYGFANNPLAFRISGSKAQLAEGGGPFINLNSDAVSVSNLSFIDIPSTVDSNEGVAITIVLAATTSQGSAMSQGFSMTKYLRK